MRVCIGKNILPYQAVDPWITHDVARAFSSNNHRFLLVYHLVQHYDEILAETGIAMPTDQLQSPSDGLNILRKCS